MKIKILLMYALIISVAVSLILAGNVYAIIQPSEKPDAEDTKVSTTTSNRIQNQNQVETENEGDNTEIRNEIQEQENTNDEGIGNQSDMAVQNMSQVALKVQDLLKIKTTGGIGDQVRLIAQNQNQAQVQIQEHLNKLDAKGKFIRFITGPDFKALNNLQQELEQNQLRVTQLTELQNQLTNQDDLTAVQETVQALVQENTTLQNRINQEQQTRSLFGWLFKLFVK